MNARPHCLALILAGGTIHLGAATELWVAQNGDDSHPGTRPRQQLNHGWPMRTTRFAAWRQTELAKHRGGQPRSPDPTGPVPILHLPDSGTDPDAIKFDQLPLLKGQHAVINPVAHSPGYTPD